MPVPILATKLFVPPPPSQVILRPRLNERLNRGLWQNGGFARKLTLISAPAGFGKTTLVADWLNQEDRSKAASHTSSLISGTANHPSQVAWLSLDEGDSDTTRFLTYFVTAVQTVAAQYEPNFGQGVLDALQSPQPPPLALILTTLLNEITVLPGAFFLVLDDYHLIDAGPVDVFASRENSSFGGAKTVDDALAFLLEHLPPQMHLVITTREDPQLPLPRLRARGQVNELRAADLRFTPSEAAEFLNSVMGFDLSAQEITSLEDRTEGWIAGLQLAALSMGGSDDIPGFIRSFAGDHRYIVDYLVAEVLQRQPEPERSFLLQTSILERLNGSLCDAVTRRGGGKAQLQALQRGNFFLIPLDDKRNWFRYHHLFSDVLLMHLMAEQPGQIPALHLRASIWYEQNGFSSDAIRHALAGENFDRAADLIERAVPEMRRTRQESALLGWLKVLPDELFHNRPVLSVHYAGILLQNGHLDGVQARLRDAERWLNMPADTPERPVFVDQAEFQRLPGLVAMYHAAMSLAQGDVANTMKHARRVLELAREDDEFPRGAASSVLGLAFWTSGDLETAYRMYSKGMAHLQRVGFTSDVIGGSVTLADIRITQGRLSDAMSIYEHGLQLATKQGTPALRGAADMHVGMSDLYREHDELNTAAYHLLKSKELGELNGLPKNPYRWRVAMARVREAQGDLDGALELLDEAERVYVGDFSPNVRPLRALRSRVWVVAGKLSSALRWARERGLSAGDDLSYLREFEHITLCRILLAQSKIDGSDSSIREAMGLLERLRQAAERGGRMGSVIEILILQALAHQMQNDIPAALASLERALTLAEPEGYVRLFLDEGPRMAQLLAQAAARGILPGYTAKLLATLKAGREQSATESALPTSPAAQPLLEPLSERELEVLRFFKTELSGPEIADELVIALSTVRSHTKNIYSKLHVNNRRAAVQRAAELGLI